MAALYSDTPLCLISTPCSQTGKTDDFTRVASHMAVVHNGLILGYNSIYQQAPYMKPADYADFINYSLAWHRVIHAHHQGEEKAFFPEIEAASGVPGLMDGELAEHAAFHTGLDEFEKHLAPLRSDPASFQATALLRIMDSFGPALSAHLANEPPKLVSLAQYPGINIEAGMEKAAQHGIKSTSLHDMGVMFYNMDLGFEGGMWKDIVPIPALIKWVIINVIARWHASWWRFGSCGANGQRRQLLALREDYKSG